MKNYQTAIVNQPEMPELYLAIAELETKRNNFDAALKNIDEVLVLTNDAPENIKEENRNFKKSRTHSRSENRTGKTSRRKQRKTNA